MSETSGRNAGAITELLARYQRGDKQAEQQLTSAVYPELRKIAAAKLRGERP
ncbi:MAG: RNA polymerase subunit sigma-70, partial [bacterium]|nr:RNA polymerase subunit sigma-70 [bacterium]